jgi:restriction system protein
VKQLKPSSFEELVIDLLLAMGYGGSGEDAGHVIGKVGDGGIDGVIYEDRLGLDILYVQAKRWEGTVGRPTVMGFAGSLDHVHAKKGIILATSYFSQEATEYVSKIEKKIVLIDGEKLAQLMIDFDVGVTETTKYIIKDIDSDYLEQIGG